MLPVCARRTGNSGLSRCAFLHARIILPGMRDYLAEINATPVPKDVFSDLVNIALQALRGERRAIPPDAERCLEDAAPGTLMLSDIPENQMGMSIVAECRRRFPKKQGEAIAQSFICRWWAIGRAKRAGRLNDFCKSNGDGSETVHSAIFDAAAECPLELRGDQSSFDSSYVRRCREIKAAEDAAEAS